MNGGRCCPCFAKRCGGMSLAVAVSCGPEATGWGTGVLGRFFMGQPLLSGLQGGWVVVGVYS